MNEQFDGSISKALVLALGEENPDEKILQVMETFASNRLGINANRNYFVLNINADVLGSSIDDTVSLDITDNIITAMSGEVGDEIKPDGLFMDYAWPVKDNDTVKYIVYVRDNKEDVKVSVTVDNKDGVDDNKSIYQIKIENMEKNVKNLNADLNENAKKIIRLETELKESKKNTE